MVLEDVAFGLTHSCAEIKLSVEASGSGQYKKMSRDFLISNAVTTTIARGRTAWKRKCCLYAALKMHFVISSVLVDRILGVCVCVCTT